MLPASYAEWLRFWMPAKLFFFSGWYCLVKEPSAVSRLDYGVLVLYEVHGVFIFSVSIAIREQRLFCRVRSTAANSYSDSCLLRPIEGTLRLSWGSVVSSLNDWLFGSWFCRITFAQLYKRSSGSAILLFVTITEPLRISLKSIFSTSIALVLPSFT